MSETEYTPECRCVYIAANGGRGHAPVMCSICASAPELYGWVETVSEWLESRCALLGDTGCKEARYTVAAARILLRKARGEKAASMTQARPIMPITLEPGRNYLVYTETNPLIYTPVPSEEHPAAARALELSGQDLPLWLCRRGEKHAYYGSLAGHPNNRLDDEQGRPVQIEP